MSIGSRSTVVPAQLVAQAVFTLLVGIFVSICTLAVQAFVVLLGRRADRTESPPTTEDFNVESCSICRRSVNQ